MADYGFIHACINLSIFATFLLLMLSWRLQLKFLNELPPTSDYPPVSVIIPALNEARNIEQALSSVLAMDYPNLEVIVVNDRSTDRTGEILARMGSENAMLKVVNVMELPPGWLGKNHALAKGASLAEGEYLLFTDADVVMAPSTLSRAIGRMLEGKLDHLTIWFGWKPPSTALRMFFNVFNIIFALYCQPWKVKDPKSRCHIGIGAFNLVRRTAYEAAGTHKTIAMRPDDDVKLGKLMKLYGFRQELVMGKDMVTVEWYATFRELVKGFEKNSFAVLDYSLPMLCAGTCALVGGFVVPFIMLFISSGPTLWTNMAVVAVFALICLLNTDLHGSRFFPSILGIAPGALIFIYFQWRSAMITYMNNGINWRGTHYPLDELRANRI
jgi:cellulose synthase/poly-beta-1,6-N-acetylglucosamine synthase-like glycosyltransferase